MDASFVDLHCHSTASDGTLPPREVVRLAKESNLSALALTDHDTIAGVAEAADEAKKLGIDFLPGIEISCQYPRPGTMHLLGYGINPKSQVLSEMTQKLIGGRDERNAKIIDALQKQNVAISMEEVEDAAHGEVVGRPHIAHVLLNKGYVNSIKQAFDKYLGQGGSAFFDKEQLTCRQAIQMIRQTGGIPVLAHPVQLRKENFAQLENEVKNLVDMDIGGIEVIHSDHRDSMIVELEELAKRYKLVPTGGSDFHGSNKPHIRLGLAGSRHIPRAYFDNLVNALDSRNSSKSS
jgi:predicted metal-dependent phosphoesterase TrpH